VERRASRPATLVPTGETPVLPSTHYVDRDMANECTVSLNTLPRCS
jgi:hypothetical protein